MPQKTSEKTDENLIRSDHIHALRSERGIEEMKRSVMPFCMLLEPAACVGLATPILAGPNPIRLVMLDDDLRIDTFKTDAGEPALRCC